MKKLFLSSRLMTIIFGVFELTVISKVMAEDEYPFKNLPATVVVTLDIETATKETFINQLLGYSISGYTTTENKTNIKKFDPITIRFTQ